MLPTKPMEKMTDQELEQHALGILRRELGLYGFARFLSVYRAPSGDYTRDRHQWQDGTTVEDLLKELPPLQ